jgi:hypothetical protein
MKTPYIRSIYVSMQNLTDITKKNILKRNYKRVERCFGIADRLLRTGNAQVKNAVENVFVYSIGIWLDGVIRKDDRERVMQLLPASLKAEYCHQINAICG